MPLVPGARLEVTILSGARVWAGITVAVTFADEELVATLVATTIKDCDVETVGA
jgi:hypothetical protein